MNILFLTDEFFPDFGANSLVVRAVCEQLAASEHNVFVMPFVYNPALPAQQAWENIHIIRQVPQDNKVSLQNAIKRLDFIQAFKILGVMAGAKMFGPDDLRHKKKICARPFLENMIAKHNIDTVVSINCSVELSFPLLFLRKKGRLNCKWIFYMLDPFESHEYYRSHSSVKKLRRLQHKIMDSCDKVFATELIYKDTAVWEEKSILDKIVPVEFPKISKPTASPCEDDVTLPENVINIVCTGSKNEAVRNSAYTLELCRRLENEKIMFHFVGNGWTEGEKKQQGNIIFYPPRSWQAVRNMQLGSDFLINIGNAVYNQLPSKVLEYISCGKPIINVYKSDLCPAKQLLERWDALNISEQEDIETSLADIKDFLAKAHPKVSFNEIEDRYAQYTPAAVAENFLIFWRENED